MSDCQKCGGELDSDGLCMACMLEGGIPTEAAPSLARSAETQAAPTRDSAGSADLSYDSFGPYSIVRAVGQGGMGVVYLAEQRQPIQRQVALKVIKLGMDTKAILARFMYERQALALMEHPNIARVFDASSTAKGRPFFVMEYIDGVPITTYCDRHRMNTRERLRLFIPVCQAVQHAHSKGVLHRDIKPSNVLVTEVDGAPVPKVIDFGIAKATEQSQNEQTAFTRFGQFVGTPEYMSPEAADPVQSDVDTTSDVYSLGVLLYELLAGAVPFDGRLLRKAGLAELLRIIREEEAPPLSAKLTELRDSETLDAIAENRSTNPHGLRRELSGDLNSIVMKAVEKRRQRRYESVSDLWNDVQRHLEDRPILASPPSRAYRFRKFVRRNQAAVFSAAAISLALVTGVTAALWQARLATQEREIAVAARLEAENERHRAQAQAARATLQESLAKGNLADVDRLANLMLFELDDKVKDLGGSTAARKSLVALGLQYLQKSRSDNPQLGAAYYRLAELQGVDSLLDLEEAKISYRLAIPLLEVRAGAHPPDSESRRLLALSLWRLSRLEDAEWRQEAGLRNAESVAAALLAGEPRNTPAMHALANIWIDGKQPAKAMDLEQRAAAAGATAPDDRAMLAKAQLAMAVWSFTNTGNSAALDWASRAVSTMEKIVAVDPGNARYRIQLSASLSKLALYQRTANQASSALVSARRANSLAADAAAADRENPRAQAELANSESTLALLATHRGATGEAKEHAAREIAIRRRQMEKYPNVPAFRLELGLSLINAFGRENANRNFKEAAAILREAEELLRLSVRRHPESRMARRYLYRALSALGGVLISLGQEPAARATLREAVSGERSLVGSTPNLEDADALAATLQAYAVGLDRFGDTKEAIRQLESAASILRLAGAAASPFQGPLQRFARVNQALANLYIILGDFPAMLAHLDELFPVIEKSVLLNPNDSAAVNLKWSYLFLYRVYGHRTGLLDRSVAAARESLATARRYYDLDPTHIERRGLVFNSLVNLTGDLQRSGYRQEALRQTYESIEFINSIPLNEVDSAGLRIHILNTYSYFVRFLAGDFNEPLLAVPHALRVVEQARALVVANPSHEPSLAFLESAYNDASSAHLNAARPAEALVYRQKAMESFLRRPPQAPVDHYNLAHYQLKLGNYSDRLANPASATDWRNKALASLAKAIEMAESRLSLPGAATAADTFHLFHFHHLRASIHEYTENWSAARVDSEVALAHITRVALLQPDVQELKVQLPAMRARLVRLYAKLQLPQDAYRHAYAGRLPSPEERQLDVAAGLRVSASNMFSTGFRIEPRVDYLEEAIALVRVLPPSPARDLELAKCLRLLSTALSIRARYPSTARTASDVPRARQSLMESRDLFEVLKSANQLPAPEILELQNTTALLANLDAQLPATQSTISTQP